MTSTHTPAKAAIIDWLRAVMKATGLKATPLAKEAGLAPSTILRALDPSNPGHLDLPSIDKIVSRFGVTPPTLAGTLASGGGASGFSEPELRELTQPAALFAGLTLTPNQFVREIRTRALDLAGYLPRDEVLIDMGVAPAAGDVVIAQVYNLARATAETVLRLYDPPYIVTQTTDASARAKPLLVDDERVKIMGTVVKSIRARSAA